MTPIHIASRYDPAAAVVLFHGDCLDLLRRMPDGCARLVITSPPYNIGKQYERRRTLAEYTAEQRAVIAECTRILADDGSLCWQTGNHVAGPQRIVPLDIHLYPIFARLGLILRNRIVWHFEHGLHCSKRFSGRHETVLWFTKSGDYVFDLDPIRVPQKYPGKKYFRGPKAGQYSCNPKGKNPGDVWVFPNVKHNHVEKTIHPCQFPIELVERFVLALTRPGDLVFDPYMGVGSTAAAAVRQGRRAAGADIEEDYLKVARKRVRQAADGSLPVRERDTAVYTPPPGETITRNPFTGDGPVEPTPATRRRRRSPREEQQTLF